MKLLRLPIVTASGGFSKSHLFNLIAEGLFTRPVKLSSRLSVWPEYEAHAIHAAGIAGWDKSERKRLVAALLDLRRGTPGMSNDAIEAAVARIVQRVGPSPAAAA